MDVEQWIVEFLTSRELTCRTTTLATYSQCLKAFNLWLECRPISPLTVQAYLVERKKGRAEATIQNDFRMLKTFCRYLVEVGKLERDPFVGAGRVPNLPHKRQRRQTYAEADIVRLLTVCGPIHWKRERKTDRRQWRSGGPLEREMLQGRALVLVLVDSAMRAGEVARLTCGQARASELVIESKGGHEDVVYLTDETRAALRALAGMRAADAPLFRDWNGEACSVRALRSLLRRMAKRAMIELPPRPLHAFRHYAAQVWAKSGMPDLVIQQLMRHANLSTTQIYTRLSDPELAEQHARASPIKRLIERADRMR